MAKAKATPAKKKPVKAAKAKVRAPKAGAKILEERARQKKVQKAKRSAALVATVALVLAGWVAYQQRLDIALKDYASQQWLESSHAAGFRFEELILQGRKLTDPQRIVEAVGLEVGDPLFMVSLDDIRERLLEIDTVRDAYVSRDLGGKIAVTLVERTPFVLWQHRGRLRVVDQDGIVLLQEAPEEYPYLITMVGAKAPANMEYLAAFLSADPELAEQISAAVFVSDRRWDIHFANGIKILLPELNPKEAWKKLANMQKEHNILQQQVEVIDLRIDDRVFITLPDEAKEAKDASDV